MIGIFGGTFDPIHLGHLHLANTVQKEANLQCIKIIPCYQSPLRQLPIASAKDRATMIKLAIGKYPHLQLDERELSNLSPSYAVNTIESIRSEIGTQTSLCFIMGDDAFAQFNKWHNWQKILKLTHLIVTTREKTFNADSYFLYSKKILDILYDHQVPLAWDLTTKPSGYIWLIDIKPLDISATTIRALVKNGKYQATQKLLPDKVWEYIKEHGLYQR